MAGIYIHIPFCRERCNYCDFYKTLNINMISNFLDALKKEACIRKNYLGKENVETIYFGGGTPSVLSVIELDEVLSFIYNNFSISDDAEITFEANPDDLKLFYLKDLNKVGINRLSIGIQALQLEHLKEMNRRHNEKQAIGSVINAEKAGFNNISVDLIYGLPGLTSQQWKSNLNRVCAMPVNHLSAYHLTYHKGTVFYRWMESGIIKELPEKESVNQFYILNEETAKAGFEMYEISNFAKNNMYSKHNTSYWTGKKYLGLGPSAHSYNGISRRWNIDNLQKYISSLENNLPFSQEEHLTLNDKFNEYILTSIRTKWGVSLHFIENQFGKEKAELFVESSKKYILLKKMFKVNNLFFLTSEGLFTSDDIIAGLMIYDC